MTDRIKALTVILEKNYREEDVQVLVDAIGLFHGVLKVVKLKSESSDLIERTRIRNELTNKLFDALKETGE